MTDRILEIIQRNYDKFTGTNEAELHAAEEIAGIVNYWKTRCLLAEKYAAATPVDLERFDASSAPHHRDVYNEFLTLNASKGEM
jgi:hypothetical protein